MLLTSIQVQEDDPQPPGIFSHIQQSQVSALNSPLSFSFLQQSHNTSCILDFYEDLIVKKRKNGTFSLLLDDFISFKVDFEKLTLTLINRDSQAAEIFITENSHLLRDCYRFLRRHSSQVGFYEKYEMGAKKGNGKNSQVYEIRRRSDNVTFAAKVQIQSASLREQINILTQLQHPNLIYFHEFFIDENHMTYIILDYENGGNLLQIMKNKTIMSQKKKVKIITDMLNGLQYLRIKGIVHRDLKLQNILYSQTDGNFKIADFGLAIKVGQPETKIVGTPGYMAPELFKNQGERVADIRSDIYSMGLIFYEMLTGHQFYNGKSTQEIMSKNIKGRSYRKQKSESEKQMSEYEKELLRRMIRTKKQKRKDSFEILTSTLFNKITKAYGLEYKSSTTSPEKSNGEEEQESNFVVAMKQLLKIKSST